MKWLVISSLRKGCEMNIADLIRLLENRLSYTQQQRQVAFNRGDVEAVSVMDGDIASTQSSLSALRSLVQ